LKKEQLNRNLKSARAKYGLSVRETAKKVGLSTTGYHNKELGKTEFKHSEINILLQNVFIEEKYEDIFLVWCSI